ncbi:LysM peptidoglycan-binding domain-containing protein [Chloroflexota bacterium]|nr:LysM peptidoglycan-binding domain-containing protein [Chloroflexota bacterium]
MKKHILLLTMALLVLIGALFLARPQLVDAGALAQSVYSTPTPNAEGQIIYTVQEGDSCTRIFLLTNVSIDTIITLNGLDEDCSIVPDQQLLLATVAPATATPEGPTPTPTLSPPTPTPFNGSAMVCVVLYEDLDGNQKRSEDEYYMAGGVANLNNREGTFSQTVETFYGFPDNYAVEDLPCFSDVPEGEYNLSMGIPNGYNATTSLNYPLTVTAGDTVIVDFGAQPGSAAATNEDPGASTNRSPLLLAIGFLMLAGGAALAFFFIRSRQNG